MLHQFAVVGLFNASLYSRDEATLVFEHAVYRLFHQLFSVFAIAGGQLLEPYFNFWRKMYFHDLRLEAGAGGVKCVP